MLLWCDGFDHYGDDETHLLDGIYADAYASQIDLQTTIVCNGTTALHIQSQRSGGVSGGIRKVLPSAQTKVGAGAHFYFPSLPSQLYSSTIFDFMSASTTYPQVSCVVDSNGCVRFYKDMDYSPSGTQVLIAQSDPIIVASAWNHIEVQVYSHATLGWVRVAVNGVHRFSATGLDTARNGDGIVSIATHISQGGASLVDDFYMDDYYIYDFTGDSAVYTDWCPTVDGSGVATNYMGEWAALYLPPTADTAEADWDASTGTDEYAVIDETNPNDADYAISTTVGDLSEFEMTDLPEEYTIIRGLMLLGRMSKSDSGVAMTRFGMKSVAAVEDAPERPITQEPTYWWDFINEDPNDPGNRWSRDALNAAWMRLTRSA